MGEGNTLALSIGVSVGSKIEIGGHILEVKSLAYPNLILVSVDHQPDLVISDFDSKEILPDVMVQVGVGQGGGGNRLAFTAPRHIRISRIEDHHRR